MHEATKHKHATFLTLTYSDDYIPTQETFIGDEFIVVSNTLVKQDLQDFFRRLRYDLPDRNIKYLACGEYGDRTERPHYHAIIFDLAPTETEVIQENWPLGHTYQGILTYDSARYVTDYIFKKWYGKEDSPYGLRENPFQLMSKGLGKDWALENHQRIIDQEYNITLNGRKVGIPRYYKKKLELSKEELAEIAIKHNNDLEQFWRDRGAKSIISVRRQIESARDLQEKTLKAKQAMFRKEKI